MHVRSYNWCVYLISCSKPFALPLLGVTGPLIIGLAVVRVLSVQNGLAIIRRVVSGGLGPLLVTSVIGHGVCIARHITCLPIHTFICTCLYVGT